MSWSNLCLYNLNGFVGSGNIQGCSLFLILTIPPFWPFYQQAKGMTKQYNVILSYYCWCGQAEKPHPVFLLVVSLGWRTMKWSFMWLLLISPCCLILMDTIWQVSGHWQTLKNLKSIELEMMSTQRTITKDRKISWSTDF